MYQHNKVVYEELKDRLKTDTRVCVVQATGTGKGVIARTLIEEYESVIVVAPTQAILKNYQMNLKVKSDNVQYFTYQAISMMLNPQLDNLAKGVTLLILDEFHRIGAKTWGRKVEYLAEKIENFNGKVVGLSATPVRYLDNERDMSVEFFNGNVVSGLNIVEAVVNGVLPTFKYVVSYYGYEKDLFKKMEERKDKLTDNIKALVANLENNYSIGKIIRQETKDLSDNQKWIVFFSSVEELESFKDTVPVWFDKKVTVYTLHSYGNYKENMTILNDFNNAEKGVNVLLSVNMLNEGVHIQGVDGVIMMRRTISPIVYLQQLGRALQVGGKEPIIFDFIGNYRRMCQYSENIEIFSLIEEINNGLKNNIPQNQYNEKKIIVNSYCADMYEIITEIHNALYSGNDWTSEELDLLVKYYPLGGVKLCIEKGLNRTIYSIQGMAKRLKIKYLPSQSTWTEEDINIVSKFYPMGGVQLCLDNGLSHRSIEDIKYIAKFFGIKKNNLWNEEYDNIIREYYQTEGSVGCIKHGVERTKEQIQRRAKILGLGYRNMDERENWTDEELNILYTYYEEYGPLYCIEKGLSHHSRQSIYHKASNLGLKTDKRVSFSDIEIEILKKYYPIGKAKLCKEKGVNRALSAIQAKAKSLGLCNNIANPWTEEELNILREYYPKGGTALCIEKGLNRPASAISSIAYTHKVKMDKNIWTEEEIELLKTYWPIGGWRSCQENGLSHKTKRNLEYMATNLGLVKNNFWTKEEDEILVNYYLIGGFELCKEKGLKRTKSSMQNRAVILDLRKGISKKEYSDIKEKAVEVYKKGGDICLIEYLNSLGFDRKQIWNINKYLKEIGLRETIERKKWEKNELDILCRYYPIEGIEVQKRLPNCSKQSIRSKANSLGLKFKNFHKSNDYSVEEDEIIRKYYPIEGTMVSKRLNNRTPDSVRCRARRLGIKVEELKVVSSERRNYANSKSWSDDEIEILKYYYPIEGKKVLERLPYRSLSSITKKAAQLKIYKM